MKEYPGPVLDWTDWEAYPKDLSGPGWAWEFLRRSPEFQAAWTEGKELTPWGVLGTPDPLPGPPERQVFPPWPVFLEAPGPRLLWPAMDVPRGEEEEVFRAAGVDLTEENRQVLEEIARVASLPFFDRPWNLTELVGIFDLREPIDPQLENFRKLLEASQKVFKEAGVIDGPKDASGSRVQWSLYPFYLLTLDARLTPQRPTFQEISDRYGNDPVGFVETLTEDTVRKRYRAAEELTKPAGYLSLLTGK